MDAAARAASTAGGAQLPAAAAAAAAAAGVRARSSADAAAAGAAGGAERDERGHGWGRVRALVEDWCVPGLNDTIVSSCPAYLLSRTWRLPRCIRVKVGVKRTCWAHHACLAASALFLGNEPGEGGRGVTCIMCPEQGFAPGSVPWQPATARGWAMRAGGLGDVMGALPKALARRGHRVMVVVPRYSNYAEGWETGVRVSMCIMSCDAEARAARSATCCPARGSRGCAAAARHAPRSPPANACSCIAIYLGQTLPFMFSSSSRSAVLNRHNATPDSCNLYK